LASLLNYCTRRPDIAAAERRVAEANQQIGIGPRSVFSYRNLGGTAGFPARRLPTGSAPSGFWAVGPALAQTLFDAGRRRATSESARAITMPRSLPIVRLPSTPFQEVEDNVGGSAHSENETQQQKQAVASSQESPPTFYESYKGGVDTYLQVITAQTIEASQRAKRHRHHAAPYDASVLLVKALGGGWNWPISPGSARREFAIIEVLARMEIISGTGMDLHAKCVLAPPLSTSPSADH